MDQESTTEGAQAATEGTSTNTGTEAGTQEASSASDQGQKTFDLDYVERLRKEAANSRVKNKEMAEELASLKAKVQENEDANLNEWERVQKERDNALKRAEQLEALSNKRSLDYEAVVLANKLGIVDPDAAVRLLDTGDIEWNEAGKPTNLQSLMESLLEKKPYLKAQTKPPVPDLTATNSASTSGRTDSRGSALTLEEIKKMDISEYSKRQEEVNAFLRNYRAAKK